MVFLFLVVDENFATQNFRGGHLHLANATSVSHCSEQVRAIGLGGLERQKISV